MPRRLVLPDLLSDHAVLQRSAATHVWGRGTPFAKVIVRIGGEGWFAKTATAETTAADDGTWLASVDVRKLGDGPYTMTVTCGGETITREDILIGEVFLASGQSNMEKPLGPRTNQHPIPDYEEIAKASALQPNAVRMATVREKQTPTPVDTFIGPWELPGETTTPKYSAVAYFAAEALHRELGVPIGIIHSSLGGSKVQVWTSREALVAGGEDPNETFRGKTSTYLYNGMVSPDYRFARLPAKSIETQAGLASSFNIAGVWWNVKSGKKPGNGERDAPRPSAVESNVKKRYGIALRGTFRSGREGFPLRSLRRKNARSGVPGKKQKKGGFPLDFSAQTCYISVKINP